MNELLSNPVQLITLAALGGVGLAFGMFVRKYLELKNLMASMFDAYLNSDNGKLALAARSSEYLNSEAGQLVQNKNTRSYLTSTEGVVFMEGVINGKIRKEVQAHNDREDAHFRLRTIFVEDKNFQGAIARLEFDCLDRKQTVVKMLKEKGDG